MLLGMWKSLMDTAQNWETQYNQKLTLNMGAPLKIWVELNKRASFLEHAPVEIQANCGPNYSL